MPTLVPYSAVRCWHYKETRIPCASPVRVELCSGLLSRGTLKKKYSCMAHFNKVVREMMKEFDSVSLRRL